MAINIVESVEYYTEDIHERMLRKSVYTETHVHTHTSISRLPRVGVKLWKNIPIFKTAVVYRW